MNNSLLILLPVILTAAGALVALATEPLVRDANKQKVAPWLVAVFTVLAAASLIVSPDGTYYHVYAMDPMRRLFSLSVLFCLLLGVGGVQWTLAREKFLGGEAYGLLALASTGALLMTLSTDFLALFIGMELAAFPVYSLVGIRRSDSKGNEATFKYFVTGAVMSALYLYGASLCYGASGSTAFDASAIGGRELLSFAGTLLILVGLFFKAGAFPAHFWVADVYTGAPVAVTAFMAAVVKVGALAALASLWQASNPGASVRVVVALIALVSVIFGAFGGLAQKSVRRILAYSAVMNAGFLATALLLYKDTGEFFGGALQFFLVTYAVASAGALTGVAYLSGAGDERETLDGLRGLARKAPGVGTATVICLASLAGLPPVAGFLAKFELFTGLFKGGYGSLASAAFILSLIAAVYYLRIAYVLFTKPEGELPDVAHEAPESASWLLKAGVAIAALAMLVLSVFPDWVCF